MRAVRVAAKKSDIPYESVERYLPRPNPTVDGRKAATVMKHARINMSDDVRGLLAQLTRQLRRENRAVELSRRRGRPRADIHDVAFAAVLRVAEQYTYEQLDREIDLLYGTFDGEGRLITAPFKHPRVAEAMTGVKSKWYPGDDREDPEVELRLTRVLEQIRARLRPLFSKVVTVAFLDGMVLSTSATDSARRGSYSRSNRGLRVELHVMYDHRWGIMTGWRLTWHNRGRGSAEAPQFPYLLKTTKEGFPLVRLVGGDGAYGSDRNHAISLRSGVQLIAMLKDEQFEGKTVHLSDVDRLYVKEVNGLDSPLFRQFSPFRNRAEGHHETVRHILGRNLLSEPDRTRYPVMTAKELKATPNAAEATLPEDQAERDYIIETEQFVGRACHNEMLCREIATLLRATAKAQRWYNRPVDFAYPVPFEPRPEDEAFSIFRPRLADDAA